MEQTIIPPLPAPMTADTLFEQIRAGGSTESLPYAVAAFINTDRAERDAYWQAKLEEERKECARILSEVSLPPNFTPLAEHAIQLGEIVIPRLNDQIEQLQADNTRLEKTVSQLYVDLDLAKDAYQVEKANNNRLRDSVAIVHDELVEAAASQKSEWTQQLLSKVAFVIEELSNALDPQPNS